MYLASDGFFNWLDGVPGPLRPQGGRASLAIGGGTGVLLKAAPNAITRRE